MRTTKKKKMKMKMPTRAMISRKLDNLAPHLSFTCLLALPERNLSLEVETFHYYYFI